MRKIFAFCILLTAIQLSYSEGNLYYSLKLQLTSANANTQKLEILKQLVPIAFGSDLQKELAYAKEGVQPADEIGDKNRQPEFYEMEGRMHAR